MDGRIYCIRGNQTLTLLLRLLGLGLGFIHCTQ